VAEPSKKRPVPSKKRPVPSKSFKDSRASANFKKGTGGTGPRKPKKG